MCVPVFILEKLGLKRSVSLRGERLVLLKKKNKNKGPCSLSPRCPFQNLLKTYEGIDLYFDKKEDLDRYHDSPSFCDPAK